MRLGSEWRRLHPLSPLLRAGRFVVVVALFADDLVAQIGFRPPWLGLFLPGVLAVGAVVGWWAWLTTRYRVTDEEVELRTGMLFRRHRRLPIARLESIDLARPLVARFLGLAQVRLEAVSQGDSEVRLSYLDEVTATGLRDQLRAHLKEAPAVAAQSGPVLDQPIIQVRTAELLLASVVGSAVGTWSLFLGVTLVIVALGGPSSAEAFARAVGPPVAFVPLLVGLVEAERLYGFTLGEVGGRLDVRRGLLNQMHQVVPIDRVQAISLIEPLLWRPFGRAKLVVDVAGYRGSRQEQQQFSSVLLPIAPLSIAADVLRRTLPGLRVEALSYVRAPAASRWRAPIRWRRYSVAWDERYAVTQRGLLRRRTDFVPHLKVQSLRVTQGPWQRALDLATLHLDTAGTQVRARARHRERSDAARLAWASRAAAVHLVRPISRGAASPDSPGP